MTHLFRSVVPKLEHHLHKGQMGRIGIIGGSVDYTGAPYYAAQAGLYYGADLATIFTAKEALIPIKSYSPEFMVTSLYDTAEIEELENEAITKQLSNTLSSYFSRLHILVIGPGLGRHPKLLPNLVPSIRMATESRIQMVFDADGLYLVSLDLNIVRGNHRCVLTPNINEFRMLVKRAIDEIKTALDGGCLPTLESPEVTQRWNELVRSKPEWATFLLQRLLLGSLDQQLHSLCTVLGGVTILLKGESDMVCGPRKSTDGQLSLSFDGVSNVYVIETPNHGSPRRCGGQGDILSGCVAVSVLWSSIVNTPTTTVRPLNAMNETAISINEEDVNREDIYVADAPKDSPTLLGCILASTVVKSASHSAFVKKGRSMTSPDVLNEIGTAFERVVGRESY